jgi:hypothetical protein
LLPISNVTADQRHAWILQRLLNVLRRTSRHAIEYHDPRGRKVPQQNIDRRGPDESAPPGYQNACVVDVQLYSFVVGYPDDCNFAGAIA